MSLFSRRYMRSGPGRTEKSVGVLVLVLLGLIVGAFLTTGFTNVFGLPEKKLFTVDTKYLERTLPSVEQRHAQTLFPPKIAQLEREDDIAITHLPIKVEQSTPDPLLLGFEDLLTDTGKFDAGLAYACRYGDGSVDYSVMIVDAGDAARAFGLARAREAKAAFQAGRYYGEVHGPDDAQGLADALAGRMLDYGRPFWAESILPAAGRADDTLRYIHRNAFDVPGLGPCWMADYESGATVVVARMPDDRRAELLDTLRETAAEAKKDSTSYGEHASYSEASSSDESGSYGEESAYGEASSGDGHSASGNEARTAESPTSVLESLGLGDAACAVRLDERGGVAIKADTYLFIVLSGGDDAIATLAMDIRDRWSQAQAAAAPAVSSPKTKNKHFPAVEGLEAPATIESYIDNLYEKIDGREPQFLAYDFVELKFGQYADTRGGQSYDTYVFDMGEPVNAFGIYAKERSASTGPAGVGRASYQSGTSTFFCKGPYYVYVLGPADGGDEAAGTSLKIAEAIAETIEADPEPFWAEKLLPEADRVPNSLSYHATSALSYKFLNKLFLAKYKTDGEQYEMFLIRAESGDEAAALYRQLAESFESSKYDEVKSRTKHDDGGETLVSDSLGYFTVVFHKDRYFGGVRECENRQLAELKAEELRARLGGSAGETASGEQSG